LSDVNLSRRPAFSTGRVRRVDVAELIAEGVTRSLRPPRLRVTLSGDLTAVRWMPRDWPGADQPAGERRRHVPGPTHRRRLCRLDDQLRCEVHDRGPGVPEHALGELTRQVRQPVHRRGTAGWVVDRAADHRRTRGTLQFRARAEGGLTASFTIPVA
jgi:hypothetical protein